MEVADGQASGLACESLVRGGLDAGERENIRKALLEYCRQDTLAMVRLVEKLQHVSERFRRGLRGLVNGARLLRLVFVSRRTSERFCCQESVLLPDAT